MSDLIIRFSGDASAAIEGIRKFRDEALPILVDWVEHAQARYVARGCSAQTAGLLIDRDLSAWFGMDSLEQDG